MGLLTSIFRNDLRVVAEASGEDGDILFSDDGGEDAREIPRNENHLLSRGGGW